LYAAAVLRMRPDVLADRHCKGDIDFLGFLSLLCGMVAADEFQHASSDAFICMQASKPSFANIAILRTHHGDSLQPIASSV